MTLKRFILALVASMVLLTLCALIVDRIPPTYNAAEVVDEATIAARALEHLTRNDPNAEIVDIRMVTYEDANRAVGTSSLYEIPFGFTPETFPAEIIGRNEPAWVVAVASKQVGHLPMFGGGDFGGVFAIYLATDGGMRTLRSSDDVRRDPAFLRLQQMENLAPEASRNRLE